MDDLEKRLRAEIVKISAEDQYNKLIQDSQLMKALKESAKKQLTAVVQSIMGDDFEKEDLAELKEEINQQYCNPEILKRMVLQSAKQNSVTYRGFKVRIGKQISMLRESGEFNEAALTAYAQSVKPLEEYLQLNDRIVRRLTDIARETDIKTAVSKETQYKVLKEFFPTAEKLRDFMEKRIQTVENVQKSISSAMQMDGERGQLMSKVVDVQRKVIGTLIKQYKNEIEEAVQKIYVTG